VSRVLSGVMLPTQQFIAGTLDLFGVEWFEFVFELRKDAPPVTAESEDES
jgi:hypothetical protein